MAWHHATWTAAGICRSCRGNASVGLLCTSLLCALVLVVIKADRVSRLRAGRVCRLTQALEPAQAFTQAALPVQLALPTILRCTIDCKDYFSALGGRLVLQTLLVCSRVNGWLDQICRSYAILPRRLFQWQAQAQLQCAMPSICPPCASPGERHTVKRPLVASPPRSSKQTRLLIETTSAASLSQAWTLAFRRKRYCIESRKESSQCKPYHFCPKLAATRLARLASAAQSFGASTTTIVLVGLHYLHYSRCMPETLCPTHLVMILDCLMLLVVLDVCSTLEAQVCSIACVCSSQATQALTQQLGRLVSVHKVHIQKHRNSDHFNGCAIVDLADRDDSPATAQVQSLLQPELHARLALPIQPKATPIPVGAHERVLGCPQIAPFSGHSRTNREHNRGNYARISCDKFVGLSSAAAMHGLCLQLCDVAEQDSMEDNMQADRAELLSAMQIIQPTVSKPDSYRDHEASEAALSPYLTVKMLSKDSVLRMAARCSQGDTSVGTLRLTFTAVTLLPRPDPRLELRFDITGIMDSFSSVELPTLAQQADPDFLNPLNTERKGILHGLLQWCRSRGLHVQLLGEGLDDCFAFIKPNRAAIAFRTYEDKWTFMAWHRDGKPFFTTNRQADVFAVLEAGGQDETALLSHHGLSAPNKRAAPSPEDDAKRAAARQANFEAKQRNKKRKVPKSFASLKLG